METKIDLKNSFDDIFSSYTEMFIGDYLFYEGKILEDYLKASDEEIIYFISGGRRYKDYKIESENGIIKGRIKHYPYKRIVDKRKNSQGRPKISKEQVRKIRELNKEKLHYTEIGKLVGVSRITVSNVVNRKGCYS